DKMYVLFQREVLEEEHWGSVWCSRCLELSKRIRQRQDLIAELEVLGPCMLTIKVATYLKEIQRVSLDVGGRGGEVGGGCGLWWIEQFDCS
ncbi:hypothetical protein Tco_1280000, partial [Tanacetum coccineum]